MRGRERDKWSEIWDGCFLHTHDAFVVSYLITWSIVNGWMDLIQVPGAEWLRLPVTFAAANDEEYHDV